MADPLILAFDTSAAHCAAALLSGDRVLAERAEAMDKGQAERLFPLLEDLLTDAGCGWRDLTALGVGTGPGNFTGVRIAVAAARGLALSLDIPAIGIPGLEALAFGRAGPVRAALPAPRGALYLQDFRHGEAVGPARIADTDDAEFWPQAGQSVPVGDWPDPPQDRPDLRVERPDLAWRMHAIARLALRKAETPQPRPAPLYLRPADAAPARDGPPLLLP